jgi:hypothetical protein
MITRVSIYLCLVWATTANAADVRLRSAAVCVGSVVRVADVAEVFGNDQRLTQSLAELPLCPTPAAGRQKVLSQDDVRQLLEMSGVERKLVTITGSEAVTISGTGTQAHGSPVKQPMAVNGVRQAAFEVPATPAQPVSRPAAQRAVAPSPFAKIDEEKTPVVLPLIEKGRGLTVVARSSGVQITTSGKAIDAGGLGEMIAVELADTKQRVFARVTGPQTVELTTGPTTDAAVANTAKN